MSFLAGSSRRDRQGQSGGSATYRHLLSPQAMTPANPLRVIAHCDIDAAYAQFEQIRLGLPDDIPLICAQWQSIIAVNYPARKYGIKRFTTLDEARKMCPHLVVQHVATYRNGEAEAGYWGEVDPRTHKVSLDPYRRESLKILAIFKDMIPLGEIEKASIDEAFLDLTPMVIERLLALHPHLATVPDDAPDGLDSELPLAPPINWAKAGNVFPINGVSDEATDAADPDGHDDLDGEGDRRSDDGRGEDGPAHGFQGDTWEDWALCLGAEIMAELRGEVFKRLHYTCSAGIAHNKAMAKLCSAWKKPNNQTVLRESATATFLRDRDFTDIRLLGGKLGNSIANEYGAKTVGDMLSVSLEEMQRRFGEESLWVYNILRGIDHTEVKGRVATKSMLASKNTRPAVTTPEQGIHWLNVLGGELNVRLREAREIAPGLWPKTLVLSHRQGIDPSRSRQTPFPFTRNLSTEYIVRYARKLWDEATQPMKNGNMKLNNIALAFTGLERLEEGQKGIENFFSANASGSKTTSKSKATTPISTGDITPTNEIDLEEIVISDGEGEEDIAPIPISLQKRPRSPIRRDSTSASNSSAGPSPKKPRLPTLHTNKKKTGLESFLTPTAMRKGEVINRSESPSLMATSAHGQAFENSNSTSEAGPSTLPTREEGESEEGKWTCPQCSTIISLPSGEPEGGTDEEERSRLLKSMTQEHEDWHFAMSLQDDGAGVGAGSRTGTASGSNNRVGAGAGGGGAGQRGKVKKKEKQGIKAFFTPKNK